MPRPPRIAYNGAIYHVTIHGNNDETVFRDDQDDRTYLHLLTRMLRRRAIKPQRRESLYRRFIEDGLTGLWTPKQEGVSRIAIAAAAVLDAGGMPRAALCRQTPRNRTRTLLMGVLRGVEGLSTAEIAGY